MSKSDISLMRKEFERHILEEGWKHPERDGMGYRRTVVQTQWISWQAGWSAAIKQVLRYIK